MKKIIGIMLVASMIVMGLAAVSALAECTSYATVLHVNVNNNQVEIQLDESINPAGCSSGNGWYCRSLSDVGTKEMLAIALGAHMAGRKIKIRVLGDTCQGSYPKFDYVSVE